MMRIVDTPLPAPSARRERVWNLVHALLRPVPGLLGVRLRRAFYRPFFAELGSSVRIADGVQIRAPWGIRLAEQTGINIGACLDGLGGLSCGRRTLIGPYAVLQTTEHLMPSPGDNYGFRFAPVTIGAWSVITGHVVVTAGITIGEAALVGAGAVVTHDVADGEVVAGVPARRITVAAQRRGAAGSDAGETPASGS